MKRKSIYTVLSVVMMIIYFLSSLYSPIIQTGDTQKKELSKNTINYNTNNEYFKPSWLNNTEERYYTDGANHYFISQYGNYSFIQPLYIMKYEFNGTDIIKQSMFILQENNTGTWLALLNYGNIIIQNVNDTQYLLTWDIIKKIKGIDYTIVNVILDFNFHNSRSKPKLSFIINITPNWYSLGYNDYRIIWDIIPENNFKYYFNQTSSELIELSTTIEIDLGNKPRNFITDTDIFLLTDVTDSKLFVNVRGGNDPYWNTRGIVYIFPVNENIVDPYTITSVIEEWSTEHETQRKVFRNPRGLKYYYALIGNNIYELIPSVYSRVYRFYYSQYGEIWTECGVISHFLSTDNTDFVTPSLDIIEDEANSRLLIASVDIGNEEITVSTWILNDTDILPDYTAYYYPAHPTDDGYYNVDVTIDDSGYIWTIWIDEFTQQGKQRFVSYVHRSNASILGLFDYNKINYFESWDGTEVQISDNSYIVYNNIIGKTSIVSLSNTTDYFSCYGVYSFSDNDLSAPNNLIVKGKAVRYNSTTLNIQLQPLENTLSVSMYDEFLFSVVVDNIDNITYIFINENVGGGRGIITLLNTTTIGSYPSNSSWGTFYKGELSSLSLAITNESLLYRLWTNGTSGYIYYETSYTVSQQVSSSWNNTIAIYDNMADDDNDDLERINASYYFGYNYNRIGLIYYIRTENITRFVEIPEIYSRISITYYYNISQCKLWVNQTHILNTTEEIYTSNYITRELIGIMFINITFRGFSINDILNTTNHLNYTFTKPRNQNATYEVSLNSLGYTTLIIEVEELTTFVLDNAVLIVDIILIILGVISYKWGLFGLLGMGVGFGVIAPMIYNNQLNPFVHSFSIMTILVVTALFLTGAGLRVRSNN